MALRGGSLGSGVLEGPGIGVIAAWSVGRCRESLDRGRGNYRDRGKAGRLAWAWTSGFWLMYVSHSEDNGGSGRGRRTVNLEVVASGSVRSRACRLFRGRRPTRPAPAATKSSPFRLSRGAQPRGLAGRWPRAKTGAPRRPTRSITASLSRILSSHLRGSAKTGPRCLTGRWTCRSPRSALRASLVVRRSTAIR